MGIKIFWGLLLLAACAGGYYLVQNRLQQNQMADGSYTCTGCMTPAEKARFDKINSGEAVDGQSQRKSSTPKQETAASPQTSAAAKTVAPTPAPAPVATVASAPAAPTSTVTPNGVPAQPQSAIASFFTGSSSASPATPPVADSQSPNAPNGMRYTGSGAYQWYRQGNLTWRVDTVSGRSCIAFATLEEWRKEIVLSHGCGRGA